MQHFTDWQKTDTLNKPIKHKKMFTITAYEKAKAMASECHNQQHIEEALMKMHELTKQACIRYIRANKAIQKNEEFRFILERMAQIAETSETEVEE